MSRFDKLKTFGKLSLCEALSEAEGQREHQVRRKLPGASAPAPRAAFGRLSRSARLLVPAALARPRTCPHLSRAPPPRWLTAKALSGSRSTAPMMKWTRSSPFDFAQSLGSATQSRRSGGRSIGVLRSMLMNRAAMPDPITGREKNRARKSDRLLIGDEGCRGKCGGRGRHG